MKEPFGRLSRVLQGAASQGRVLLVIGLLAGFALPDLALAMRPWLPSMVAFLMAITALRIGLRAAIGNLRDARANLGLVLLLQVAAPVLVMLALMAAGWQSALWGTAAVLALAAPSISGSPPFSVMLGQPPEQAMRLLILGTGLVPLTVLPVFWLSPAFGAADDVAAAALRLALVLALAIAAGVIVRRCFFPDPSEATLRSFDGLSAITLAVLVIGLMSAVGPALRTDPSSLVPWIALAFTLNFGMQLAARAAGADIGTAIVAGNRNIALFLVALPEEIVAPLLLFIGCYQIPMYLTPLLMKPVYARF